MQHKLYLIPSDLGTESPSEQLTPEIIKAISELNYFIVEEIRTARRFIKKVVPSKDINSLQFGILNEHTALHELESLIEPLKDNSVGLLSEAGVPCVADPGALIVNKAHQMGIEVVPLVGPSSILLALIASGLNGQNFAFNGYLPIKHDERARKLKQLEKRSIDENQTQLFIEAPYRNNQMLADIITSCLPSTLLNVACDLTLLTQYIKTQSINHWKKEKVDLHKRPTVFALLGNSMKR
jgi:16S rRNA (cytidine1402-2'-O)-methyltransferase